MEWITLGRVVKTSLTWESWHHRKSRGRGSCVCMCANIKTIKPLIKSSYIFFFALAHLYDFIRPVVIESELAGTFQITLINPLMLPRQLEVSFSWSVPPETMSRLSCVHCIFLSRCSYLRTGAVAGRCDRTLWKHLGFSGNVLSLGWRI